MTAKDYIIIADALRMAREAALAGVPSMDKADLDRDQVVELTIEGTVLSLSLVLWADNNRFSFGRFAKACGLSDDEIRRAGTHFAECVLNTGAAA